MIYQFEIRNYKFLIKPKFSMFKFLNILHLELNSNFKFKIKNYH